MTCFALCWCVVCRWCVLLCIVYCFVVGSVYVGVDVRCFDVSWVSLCVVFGVLCCAVM